MWRRGAPHRCAQRVFVRLYVCGLCGGGRGAFVSFHFYLFVSSGLRSPRSLCCTVRVRCAVARPHLYLRPLGFASCIVGGIRIPRPKARPIRCDLDMMLGRTTLIMDGMPFYVLRRLKLLRSPTSINSELKSPGSCEGLGRMRERLQVVVR
ncbi:hypothetical protein K438DRAFT_575806 [Mycena galopus ATCC 62051]|nr:hypothetical protein K438DRAFT_575806 [Mycena galopus ATCC 62051]